MSTMIRGAARSLTTLKLRLMLRHCRAWAIADLSECLLCCRVLTDLSLMEAYCLTDDFVLALCEAAPQLRRVRIFDGLNLGSQAGRALMALPDVLELRVSPISRNISIDAVALAPLLLRDCGSLTRFVAPASDGLDVRLANGVVEAKMHVSLELCDTLIRCERLREVRIDCGPDVVGALSALLLNLLQLEEVFVRGAAHGALASCLAVASPPPPTLRQLQLSVRDPSPCDAALLHFLHALHAARCEVAGGQALPCTYAVCVVDDHLSSATKHQFPTLGAKLSATGNHHGGDRYVFGRVPSPPVSSV